MIFRQFRYEPISQLSYLVGCVQSGECLVVDPIADLGVDFYVLEAADRGLSITGVIDTHVHADYVSIAGELAEAVSAPRYAHRSLAGIARFPFEPVKDGDVLEFGKLAIEVAHTPGHTPEHVSLIVADRARASVPWFVLSGDCLMVGDVGRPDLLVGDQAIDAGDASARAHALFESVGRLLALPEHVELFPGHYGGSSCGGANMSGKTSSTIAFERKFNKAAALPEPLEFERFVFRTLGAAPSDHVATKLWNLGLRKEEVAS